METSIRYRTGDATLPEGDGQKILAHIVNDLGQWGSGFVLAVSARWPHLRQAYLDHVHSISAGTILLGTVQFVAAEPDLLVANMFAQEGLKNHRQDIPLRYAALHTCLASVRQKALLQKASVHGPKFGARRAGGNWKVIENIIHEELCHHGVEVTIYLF
jgi:hypothetical protein